jgi:hypothetical protein
MLRIQNTYLDGSNNKDRHDKGEKHEKFRGMFFAYARHVVHLGMPSAFMARHLPKLSAETPTP